MLRALALVAMLGAASLAHATVFTTQDSALKSAFPGATIERQSHVLDDECKLRIASLSGSKVASRLVVAYRAMKDGEHVGTAYFDTHIVRTLPEVVMIVVGPDGKASRIEVLSFGEPREYLAPSAWIAQLANKPLTPELELKRSVRGITGASLTARAMTDAVRRVLATHAVLVETAAPLAP